MPYADQLQAIPSAEPPGPRGHKDCSLRPIAAAFLAGTISTARWSGFQTGGGMGDLVVDLASLQRSAVQLKAIADQLDNAQDTADEAAAAVGSDELGGELQDFASKWKIHRKQMIKAITAAQKMASESATSFETLEQDLKDALTGARNAGSRPTR